MKDGNLRRFGRIRRLGILILVLLLSGCGSTDRDEQSPALTFAGLSTETTTRVRILSGTVEPGATVEITVGETLVSALVVNDSWSAEVTLQPGSNLVSVSAFDATGNQSQLSLSLTYDAISLETFTTPIPTGTLEVGGLVDPGQTGLALTVTLADSTTITPSAVITGDTWSASLAGLQEGTNTLLVSAIIPGIVEPVEVSLPIVVDATTPALAVAFDQGLTRVTGTSHTLTGTFDPAGTEVFISPTPLEPAPIGDPLTGTWSATLENLALGKNPVTATVVEPTSGLASVARTLLIVE